MTNWPAANRHPDDALWRELTARAALFPRYRRAYGLCESCWLAATLMQPVGEPPGRVWWCVCQPCETRWPSAVQELSTALDPHDELDEALPPALDDAVRAEFMYAAMLDLSRCHQFEPRARPASAAEETKPGGQMITPGELQRRSLADYEVRDLAAALHWPAVSWADPDGRRFSIPAGQWAWRDYPLGAPWKRRCIYLALQALECQERNNP
jgi:hypothetical protein